ncbi:MAG: type II secretion system protein GspK [Gemmataceae bacterium]
MPRTHKQASQSRRGVVLLAVVVVVVLLALAAYRYSDMMASEYRAATSGVRAIQSRSLAESGVAYTAALLATGAAREVNVFNNPQLFQNIPVPSPNNLLPGRFCVISPMAAVEGTRFGVIDEGGKINLNALLEMDDGAGELGKQLLMGLPGMTEETANAIMDWLDPDEEPRDPGGAESDVYQGMPTPYLCKNGPFDSVEELLLVQGVTPELLFGSDRNRNGILDPEEPDQGDGLGWSAYLTVYSRSTNSDPEGNQRINLNNADLMMLEGELAAMEFPNELITFILAARLYGTQNSTDTTGANNDLTAIDEKIAADMAKLITRNRPIRSIWDLVGRQVTVTVGSGRDQKRLVIYSPLNNVEMQREMLPVLQHYLTTTDSWELAPRININTAPEPVVRALVSTGRITEDEVEMLLSARPDPESGEAAGMLYQSTAWLVTEAGLPVRTVRRLERFISGVSQVYRFQVVGLFESVRPTPSTRLEVVVDVNNGRPRFLYWRDLSILGKGFRFNQP